MCYLTFANAEPRKRLTTCCVITDSASQGTKTKLSGSLHELGGGTSELATRFLAKSLTLAGLTHAQPMAMACHRSPPMCCMVRFPLHLDIFQYHDVLSILFPLCFYWLPLKGFYMLDQAQHTHMYITHYPNEDPSVSGELPECCDIYSIRVYAAIFQ